MATLLDNVNVDTTGAALPGTGENLSVIVTGDNFGSGTVTIEVSEVGTPIWVPITGVSATANTHFFLDPVRNGSQIRAVLAGSTGASNVKVVAI